MGFEAGHSITATSSWERNVLSDFTVWYGALSCINTASWFIVLLKLGTTCFFNIAFYTVALILPSSQTRCPVPEAEIMANTITKVWWCLPWFRSLVRDILSGYLSTPPKLLSTLPKFIVHWGKYRSLELCQTNLLPSQPNRLNFDSSLKWTQHHCSSVHLTRSMANFNRLILLFFRIVRLRKCIIHLYIITNKITNKKHLFKILCLVSIAIKVYCIYSIKCHYISFNRRYSSSVLYTCVFLCNQKYISQISNIKKSLLLIFIWL